MKSLKSMFGMNDKSVKSFVINEVGKAVNSKAYNCWKNMMNRCYNPDIKIAHKSVVCEEWKHFSNFYYWYKRNYYEGAELDKDWNGYHCHIYCPETCVFMPKELNGMLHDKCIGEREFPFVNGKYVATCSLGGRQVRLGTFIELEDCVNAVITARYSYSLGIADRLKIMGEMEGKTYISDKAYQAVVNHRWS